MQGSGSLCVSGDARWIFPHHLEPLQQFSLRVKWCFQTFQDLPFLFSCPGCFMKLILHQKHVYPPLPPLQMGFRSTSEWSEKVTLRVSRPQSSVASLACLSRKFSLNLLRKNMIAQACAEGQSLSGTTSVTCPRRSHWPLLISSFYSSSQWKGWHQRPCLPWLGIDFCWFWLEWATLFLFFLSTQYLCLLVLFF